MFNVELCTTETRKFADKICCRKDKKRMPASAQMLRVGLVWKVHVHILRDPDCMRSDILSSV